MLGEAKSQLAGGILPKSTSISVSLLQIRHLDVANAFTDPYRNIRGRIVGL
jgi:hypothetical protein